MGIISGIWGYFLNLTWGAIIIPYIYGHNYNYDYEHDYAYDYAGYGADYIRLGISQEVIYPRVFLILTAFMVCTFLFVTIYKAIYQEKVPTDKLKWYLVKIAICCILLGESVLTIFILIPFFLAITAVTQEFKPTLKFFVTHFYIAVILLTPYLFMVYGTTPI